MHLLHIDSSIRGEWSISRRLTARAVADQLGYVPNGLAQGLRVQRSGTIGFVGLVGPHIARMLVGEDQRFLMPASVLCGALLLSVTSIVSKIVIPGVVIPVGIITALIGVPFFIAIVFTRRRKIWS